jgi:peroxiredoxin
MTKPVIGKKVPDFTAASTAGADFQLAKARGTAVVLYLAIRTRRCAGNSM